MDEVITFNSLSIQNLLHFHSFLIFSKCAISNNTPMTIWTLCVDLFPTNKRPISRTALSRVAPVAMSSLHSVSPAAPPVLNGMERKCEYLDLLPFAWGLCLSRCCAAHSLSWTDCAALGLPHLQKPCSILKMPLGREADHPLTAQPDSARL